MNCSALSETLVVSAQGPLDNRAEAISYYYDRLATNAAVTAAAKHNKLFHSNIP